MGDGNAVIGHGNLLIPCTALPEFHFPVIEHTAAAMDNDPVRRQIHGKFCAACKCKR